VVLRGVEGAAPYRSPSGKCEPRAFGAAVRILYSPGQKEKKNRPSYDGRQGIGVFAYGKDTRSLRLKSELFDLRF
ncbi:MAG: hypothetical protein IKA67_00365, partial [Clostridia bacterium]|nr:hypothetical protein [Clostridia bacterium]